MHFQLYALIITGPDTLIDSTYHQADIWEAMLLRFGLDFIQGIKGNIVSPVLVTIISTLLLAITVVLVIKTLDIKNKYSKYITAIVFAVAPNISATLTFFYCSDAYILGMLFATMSVFLVKKFEKSKSIIFLAGMFLAFAMGMYQTYLSVAMVLAVASLIIDILNKKDIKQVLKNALRYIIMGIIGIILFYVFAYMTLFFKNLEVSNYSGANQIGIESLLNIPNLLPQSYQSFFNYYFTDKMIPNTIWHTNIFYIIIFTLSLGSLIYIVIKNKIYEKISNTILLLFLIVILPICFGVIEIMIPDVDIHILMACSMIFIIPIFFKILEMLPKTNITKAIKYIVVISTIIISWNYIWQDNASYLAIKLMQNQTENTALRIVDRIENLDNFNEDMPVLIVGNLKDNNYLSRENTGLETKKIFDRTWGFISNEPTVWEDNQDSWNKMFYEYVGVNLKLVGKDDCKNILETEEYKTMANFPDEDSIKIIENTVVVKISD